jgi:hypothetical protein
MFRRPPTRSAPRRRGALRFTLAATAFSVALSGCGVIDFITGNDGYLDGVGRIPGGEFNSLVSLPEGVEIQFPELIGPMIGPQIGGNRVLMIGDSIMASTSSRYGNEMCNTLTPLGWQVAVEAQSGSFVDFGLKVLGRRLEDGWDTAVVFLGTNFDGNLANYESVLRQIFNALAPTPMVVLTTAEFRPRQIDVNNVILNLAKEYENITVLDWAKIAANPGVIGRDGIHLSDNGRDVFSVAVARSLELPPVRDGKCIDPIFRSDAAVKDVMPSEVVVDDTSVPAVDPAQSAATTTLP